MQIRLEQSHRLVLGQQLHQSLHILQMNAVQLNAYIAEHALENPFVEYSPCLAGSFPASHRDNPLPEDYMDPAENRRRGTLRDFLHEQLTGTRLAPRQKRIVEYLVDSIDERGYLCIGDEEASMALQVPAAAINESLRLIQSLEPAGVGARSLSECLLLQLGRGAPDALAEALVSSHLIEIAKGRFHKLSELYGVTEKEILCAIERIRSLNPKPGNGFSTEKDIPYAPPDLLVERTGNELRVQINPALRFDFCLRADYAAVVRQEADTQEEKAYLRERLRTARWIKEGLARRESTLLQCGRAVLEKQRGFFLGSSAGFTPHTMSDLATELKFNISTISRALCGKTLSCERGTLPLPAFFIRAVSANNEGVSAAFVKERIHALLNQENPAAPYSDARICELLEQQYVFISRRAIAKYREELFIPSSFSRRRVLEKVQE